MKKLEGTRVDFESDRVTPKAMTQEPPLSEDGAASISRWRREVRGRKEPNYDSVNVALCEEEITGSGLPVNIIVDCAHGNSH